MRVIVGLFFVIQIGYPDGFFARPGTLWLGTGPSWATFRPSINNFVWRSK